MASAALTLKLAVASAAAFGSEKSQRVASSSKQNCSVSLACPSFSARASGAAFRCNAAGDNAVVAEATDAVEDASLFLADVASLVKLVDSRDIVELELKHESYEILIRKKEAVVPAAPQTFPGPHVMAHTAYPYPPPPPPAAAPEAAPAPVEAPPAPVAAPAPVVPAGSKMLSPMAGTFYRSPAPGEPAFVQVGDRVTKGQVVCIVEAMKLMNEIEADQSGTIVEIVAADGKGVSIESPLFIIKA